MKPFLQLNLRSDEEKSPSVDPNPQPQEPESEEARKKLIQLANRVAHKGAAHYGRSSGGVFSR